ncbi:Panacea domain-containing protein [Fibrisoma limi]|uniref:Panacea domain-containing protein n=1 Tax=Fibrisoma limi TaxID=663275 RepID=UPI001788E5DF|nr:Panacea domain-containing protein [Fibrisoma limi]
MFDQEKALNTLLYITNALGKTGFHKAFKVMYFAEREHLSLYGSAILYDTFISMDNGPVPSKLFDILKAIRENNINTSTIHAFSEAVSVENRYNITSKKKADTDYLSETEVEALDRAIALCKDMTFAELRELSHDIAWKQAQPNKQMGLIAIAEAGGANETMVSYIRSVSENESALSECPF